MLLESFLQSQKVSVARQLGKKFEKYRTRQKDTTQLLLHTLKTSIKERVSPLLILIMILGQLSARDSEHRSGPENPGETEHSSVPERRPRLRPAQPEQFLQLVRFLEGVQKRKQRNRDTRESVKYYVLHVISKLEQMRL
jgi:hypothetical protein